MDNPLNTSLGVNMEKDGENTGVLEKISEIYWRHKKLLIFAPAVILITVFFAIPMISLFRMSFYTSTGMGMHEVTFTLKNYVKLLTDPFYLKIILYTFKIAVGVMFLSLVLSYPAAYFISRTTGRLKIFLLLLVIVPLWTNLIVRIYGWFVILGRQGLINSILLATGVIEKPAALLFKTFSVVIGITDAVLPWVLLILFSILEGIDYKMIEAARDLGANRFKSFYEVTFKLSLPGISIGGLFAFVWAMGEYAVPSLLGSSSKRTISIELADQMLAVLNWPFGASIAFILFVITICALFLSNKLGQKSGHLQ